MLPIDFLFSSLLLKNLGVMCESFLLMSWLVEKFERLTQTKLACLTI